MQEAPEHFARVSLHDQVVTHLGSQITRGIYSVGQQLPTEPELCDLLHVSRPILREAMKVLAAKGLVETRPKSGTRICPRSQWKLFDPDVLGWLTAAPPDDAFFQTLSEMRLIFEPAAARMAATRATDDELREIEAWFRRMQIAVHDTETFIHADLQFHGAILLATHNEMLIQMNSMISAALRASRSITTRVPGSNEISIPQHQAIVLALLQRDGEAAARAMERLIVHAMDDIEQGIQQIKLVEKGDASL